jgi:His-Xaa-Ser repeat protein HxsA
MSKKLPQGLINLTRKTFAIITSSVAALTNTQAKPTTIIPNPDNSSEISKEEFKKLTFTPKLILRLNKTNPNSPLFFLHTSHSSHASHASHASHYSSSPSYSPPYVPPTNSTPYVPPPTYPTGEKPYSKSNSNSSSLSKYYYDTSLIINPNLFRTLYKSCEGRDVEKIQNLLIILGYDNLNTGYFGEKTELAVIKFQIENELKPDGRVTYKVYLAMRNKLL